jgi:hypothetical protein
LDREEKKNQELEINIKQEKLKIEVKRKQEKSLLEQ